MATVTGYVQWMSVDPDVEYTKVGVGPTPTDTQLLLILMDSSDTSQEVSMKAALMDAFSTALAARREVTVEYNSSDSRVTYLEMYRA